MASMASSWIGVWIRQGQSVDVKAIPNLGILRRPVIIISQGWWGLWFRNCSDVAMPQPSLHPQPIDVPVHLSWAKFRDFHWKLATAQSTLLHPLLSVKTFQPCRRLWRSATQQSRVMAPLRTLGSRLAWQLKTTQLHATKCKTEKHEKHEGTLDKATSEIRSEYVYNESFICRYVRWYLLKSLNVLLCPLSLCRAHLYWRGVALGVWKSVFWPVCCKPTGWCQLSVRGMPPEVRLR